jgi:signal transduction histidine kinase
MGENLSKEGIKVETTLDGNLPFVIGDATGLERVLINLLTNARDVMPEGGAVTIESGLLSDRPEWLRLTVADTGPGIHPEALSKIFDLLYTRKTDGTGLGLWLSRRIVQEHNGTIQAQSELGKGTVFTITLPAGESSTRIGTSSY